MLVSPADFSPTLFVIFLSILVAMPQPFLLKLMLTFCPRPPPADNSPLTQLTLVPLTTLVPLF